MKLITRSLSLAGLLLAVAPIAHAQSTIFAQNFEAGLGASESVSGLFVINNTGFGNNGTQMMGHANGYSDNEYSYYELALDLTGVTNPTMQFDYRGQFETHFDRFNVLASVGAIAAPSGLLNPTGASNMQFGDLSHDHQASLGQFAYDTSGSTGGDSGVALFDLSAFSGQMVNLRFQFGTDSSVTAGGFNMDNLLVQGNAAVPEPGSVALFVGMASVSGVMLRRRKK